MQKRGGKDTTEEGDKWLTSAVQRRVGRGRGSCYMQYRQRCGKGRVDTADEEVTVQHSMSDLIPPCPNKNQRQL